MKPYQGKFPDINTPVFTQSNIKTAEDCMFLLYKLKGEGVSSLPGVAATLGNAYHKGIEVGLIARIKGGADLPLKDKLEAACEEFRRLREATYWDPWDDYDNEQKLLMLYTKLHHERVAPKLRPKQVELFLTQSFPGYTLSGTIDLIESDNTICDHKTSKRPYDLRACENSTQAAVYSKLFELHFGSKPKTFRYDVIIKPSLKFQHISGLPKEATMSLLEYRITVLLSEWRNSLALGQWRLAREGHWRCKDKWCGLYRDGTCPKSPDYQKKGDPLNYVKSP